MGKFKRTIMWLVLIALIVLIFFSIYGAFIGAQKAQQFFNSMPLAFFWILFLLLLIAGFFTFRSLIRSPSRFLTHAGCIVILAGAIWGAQSAQKFFKPNKIYSGQMAIYQGQTESRVILKDDQVKELPFSIKLKKFHVEYYKPAYLVVQNRQGQTEKVPIEVGKQVPLSINSASVTVLKTFENFKITFQDEKSVPVDSDQPGYNPALHVLIKDTNGLETTQYVFGLFEGYFDPKHNLMLTYDRTISDYISDLQIIENGKVVTEKSIEVNHPLHFGGYHFYQSSYDAEGHEYSVLSVVSDTGLNLVYAGFAMLLLGTFWHFWLSKILLKKKITNGN
jgi:hypothetical protein